MTRMSLIGLLSLYAPDFTRSAPSSPRLSFPASLTLPGIPNAPASASCIVPSNRCCCRS